MEFQILSHAGLRVSASGKTLLCDPWLLGSCYWRSWWNYPPVSEELARSLQPDFIYLTHLHWDHFHGPSLRLFPRSTVIVVPYLRYGRMVRDIKGVGFRNVVELRHGESLKLAPDFTIRSFHIGPIFADSAVVVTAGNTVLLNANDAKLAGLPLKQILDAYPSIDFCLRSHSSANARNCMHLIGEPDVQLDDNEHYLRSFALFMNRVKPRFAIPFASNTCLLHRDVFAMNQHVQTPIAVSRYFDSFSRKVGLSTRLQVMVSGDSWSDAGGFRIGSKDWFTDRESHLAEYALEQAPVLEKFYAEEDRVCVSEQALRSFVTGLRKRAGLARFMLPSRPVAVVSWSERRRDCFAVNLRAGTVESIPAEALQSYDVRAEYPALVLLQSARLNMFSQAWISKRVHYYSTRAAQETLGSFLRALEYSEAELFPLFEGLLSRRSLRAMLPRWREGVLALQVIAQLLRRRSFMEIEARLLAGRLYSEIVEQAAG